MTVIALSFSVYKSIFSTSEIGDTSAFEEKSAQSVEESIETLENEIDIIEDEPIILEETETFTEDIIENETPVKEAVKTVEEEKPAKKNEEDLELEEF